VSETVGQAPPGDGPALLVDTHVHFHPSFKWEAFLDAAAANFAAACVSGSHLESHGCLVLTESAGVNCFRALRDHPATLRSTRWHAERTDETGSLMLGREDSVAILVIAGRQIVTSERLEVLALGMTEELPDHGSLGETLSAVADAGAIAVLPWGVGKWWGRRGRIVQSLLLSREPGSFCLGDNGGRVSGMPRPRLLDRAEGEGFVVLAGSDPLRIPSHVGRAGSFGSAFSGWRPSSRPAEAIKKRIHESRRSPPYFGSPSSIVDAVYSQLAIRLAPKHPTPL
jgi:hypothetical protein